MIAQTTINATIKEYLAAACLVDFAEEGVDEDTDLFATGLVDSLGFVDLVTFLESEFGIKVTDDDLVFASFNSVNELVQFVGEKRNAS